MDTWDVSAFWLLLVIEGNSAVNIGVQVSESLISVLLSMYLGVELLGHKVIYI